MELEEFEQRLNKYGYGAKSKPKTAPVGTAPLGDDNAAPSTLLMSPTPLAQRGQDFAPETPTAPAPTPAAQAPPAQELPPATETSAASGERTPVIPAGHGLPGLTVDPIDRDAARGALKLGGQARRLAHTLFPNLETSLETLVKQIPGAREAVHQAREFAHQPEEEPYGETIGENAPLMMVNPLAGGERMGLGLALTTAYPKAIATVKAIDLAEQKALAGLAKTKAGNLTKASKATAAQISQQAKAASEAVMSDYEKLVRRYGFRGKVAGGVSSAAAGGALGDPEHPKEGAEAGLIGAPAAVALGGIGLAKGAGALLHHIPHPHIAWFHVPRGRLRQVGHFIMDEFSRVVGRIMPAGGYQGGKYEHEHPDVLPGGEAPSP